MRDEGFTGSRADLRQFEELVNSPIRTEVREQALRAWEHYKLAAQAAFVGSRREPGAGGYGKVGIWTKGDYVRSLTARAVDLSGALLEDVCVGYADLRGVVFDRTRFVSSSWSSEGEDVTADRIDLPRPALKGARLTNASLVGADMRGMVLLGAQIDGADLRNARLDGALLEGADLSRADLRGARLTNADLSRTNLVEADLRGADISGSRVFGASVWKTVSDADPARAELQRGLVITERGEAEVTVDNLKVAQFIHLLLTNEEIRGVIDTITSKAVLILGRFTPERKAVLDTIRTELRERHDYTPIVFDFAKPKAKGLTDTVRLLASMARFVIVDLSEATSANYELGVLTQLGLRRTPFVVIAERWLPTMAMLDDVLALREVLEDVHRYDDGTQLAATLLESVVAPAESRWRQLNPES